MPMDEKELLHYASKYYDPVKAHEYYEEHKKLKGRKSTAGLNDDGKAAAKYVKDRLTTEKKSKQQDVKDKTSAAISDIKDKMSTKLESEKALTKSTIEQHKQAMQGRIDQLKSTLNNMSSENKKLHKEQIQEMITNLRAENAAEREKLNARYKATSTRLRSNQKSTVSSMNETKKNEVKRIGDTYDAKYEGELEKIRNTEKFKSKKK